METVFEKIGDKDYNMSMLISEDDKRCLIHIYKAYEADYHFIYHLLWLNKDSFENYTKPLEPLHDQVSFHAFTDVKGCVLTLASSLRAITRRFIDDVESFYMEKYHIEFTSLSDTNLINYESFFKGYTEIVANIFSQTGFDLFSAGADNAHLSLRKIISKLPATPAVSKNTISFPGLVSYKRSRHYLLSADSVDTMRLLLTVVSNLNGSPGAAANDEIEISEWRVRSIQFGKRYHVLTNFSISFSQDGRTDLLCPSDGKAASLLAKIKGRPQK